MYALVKSGVTAKDTNKNMDPIKNIALKEPKLKLDHINNNLNTRNTKKNKRTL